MKAKFLIKSLTASLFFCAMLFLCAGKFNYLEGWLFLGINFISAIMNFWTIRNDAELMKERSQAGKGTKTWDKIILGLSGITYLVTIVLAGLDSGRYHWSPDFHWGFYVFGAALMLTGQSIFLTARKQNRFFASVVRIQSERAHTVCETGIYKIIRHPGYLGMGMSLCAIPFIAASVWSIIPTAVSIALLIARTHLEDETLKKELAGYLEYSRKTKQRLIPKVW